MNSSDKSVDSISQSETSIADAFSLLKNWAVYLLRKWWVIGLFTIAGGLLGILVAFKNDATYESRLTFALDDGGGDAGGVSSIAAQFGLNIGGGGQSFFSGDNILEIMKSRRIVEAVLLSSDTVNGKIMTMIQEYKLFSKDAIKPAYFSIDFPPGLNQKNFSYKQDSILYVIAEDFSKNLIVADRPDRKLEIYEVKVTTKNEHFTKTFTDRIVMETINFYTELRIKKSKETLDILEDRVARMKGNLNSSITSKTLIQDANLNAAFAAAQAPIQKQNVNIQVYSGAYSEMFKNLELARFQYLKEIPLLQIIDEADYPMKKIKKGRLITGFKYGLIFMFIAVGILVILRYTKKNTIKV